VSNITVFKRRERKEAAKSAKRLPGVLGDALCALCVKVTVHGIFQLNLYYPAYQPLIKKTFVMDP
jgi:hypothetical protein